MVGQSAYYLDIIGPSKGRHRGRHIELREISIVSEKDVRRGIYLGRGRCQNDVTFIPKGELCNIRALVWSLQEYWVVVS